MALTDRQIELKLCPIGFELVQKENPVDASRSPQNTVFHYCDPLGIRASYCGCLHTMDAVADGRGYLRPDCQTAIENRTCNARVLRLEELKAGRALYYVGYEEIMQRRGIQAAIDRENSPIQFRRRKQEPFKPTVMPATIAEATSEEKKPSKAALEWHEKNKARNFEASSRLEDMEIDTNIMAQVAQKRLEEENDD